ncbi:hypothetical protein Pelo_16060 [Pelomyxa schiedti]|nr:hypothetical protein Pelo_16060 [Pelomyxa schiedti]
MMPELFGGPGVTMSPPDHVAWAEHQFVAVCAGGIVGRCASASPLRVLPHHVLCHEIGRNWIMGVAKSVLVTLRYDSEEYYEALWFVRTSHTLGVVSIECDHRKTSACIYGWVGRHHVATRQGLWGTGTTSAIVETTKMQKVVEWDGRADFVRSVFIKEVEHVQWIDATLGGSDANIAAFAVWTVHKQALWIVDLEKTYQQAKYGVIGEPQTQPLPNWSSHPTFMIDIDTHQAVSSFMWLGGKIDESHVYELVESTRANSDFPSYFGSSPVMSHSGTHTDHAHRHRHKHHKTPSSTSLVDTPASLSSATTTSATIDTTTSTTELQQQSTSPSSPAHSPPPPRPPAPGAAAGGGEGSEAEAHGEGREGEVRGGTTAAAAEATAAEEPARKRRRRRRRSTAAVPRHQPWTSPARRKSVAARHQRAEDERAALGTLGGLVVRRPQCPKSRERVREDCVDLDCAKTAAMTSGLLLLRNGATLANPVRHHLASEKVFVVLMGFVKINIGDQLFGVGVNDQVVVPANVSYSMANHPKNRLCKIAYVTVAPAPPPAPSLPSTDILDTTTAKALNDSTNSEEILDDDE